MAISSLDVLVGDRYRLGDEIGHGATGAVYQAVDLRLDRPVAIKVLHPMLAADEVVRARFQVEARAAARLCHPSVVTVHDTGQWDGVPYIAMECLSGGTLADAIAAGPLPPERVRKVGIAIAEALHAAHQAGMVHRDVKPGNIMLTATGDAKLGDFGIASPPDGTDLTLNGLVIGTPAYLAPERLEGHEATPASDMYALGVVLFEAASGRRPFPGSDPTALARSMRSGPPRRLQEVCPGVEPDLAAAVDRALLRSPAARHASAAQFAAALRTPVTSEHPARPVILKSRAAPELPTSPVRRQTTHLRRSILRRSMGLAGALAAAALVLLVGTVGAVVLRGELQPATQDAPGMTSDADPLVQTSNPLPGPAGAGLQQAPPTTSPLPTSAPVPTTVLQGRTTATAAAPTLGTGDDQGERSYPDEDGESGKGADSPESADGERAGKDENVGKVGKVGKGKADDRAEPPGRSAADRFRSG